MALVHDLNRMITSGNEATWRLKLALEAAGWSTVTSGSGSGGLYSASGEVCSQYARGDEQSDPDDWGWHNCWRVLEAPGGEQWLFQRGGFGSGKTYDDGWFVGYSASGGYTGAPTGSPNATTPPGTADAQTLYNSSGGLFVDDWAPGLLHIIADADGFVCFCFQSGVSQNNKLMTTLVQDNYLNADPANPHPRAVGVSVNQAFPSAGTLALATWSHYGEGSEVWTTAYYGWWRDTSGTLNPSSGGGTGGGVGYDDKERPLPMPVHEEASGYSPGVSRWFSWAGNARDYPQRADGSPYLYLGQCMVSGWDPAVQPVAI